MTNKKLLKQYNREIINHFELALSKIFDFASVNDNLRIRRDTNYIANKIMEICLMLDDHKSYFESTPNDKKPTELTLRLGEEITIDNSTGKVIKKEMKND